MRERVIWTRYRTRSTLEGLLFDSQAAPRSLNNLNETGEAILKSKSVSVKSRLAARLTLERGTRYPGKALSSD